VALPFGILTSLVVFLITRSPAGALLAACFLFIFPATLFALLVRWNAWAWDVATGAMFEPREVPPTEPVDQYPARRANEDTAPPADKDTTRPVDEDPDDSPDGDSPVSPA
jgi:hypothetical protein